MQHGVAGFINKNQVPECAAPDQQHGQPAPDQHERTGDDQREREEFDVHAWVEVVDRDVARGELEEFLVVVEMEFEGPVVHGPMEDVFAEEAGDPAGEKEDGEVPGHAQGILNKSPSLTSSIVMRGHLNEREKVAQLNRGIGVAWV